MIQYIYGYPVYKFSIEDPSKSISEVQKCIDGTKEVNPSDEWNAECLTTSSHGRGCNTNDEKYLLSPDPPKVPRALRP